MSSGAVDAKERLVVVVLIPIKGEDPGDLTLRVSAEEIRHSKHQLTEGRGSPGLEDGVHDPDQVLGAGPLRKL